MWGKTIFFGKAFPTTLCMWMRRRRSQTIHCRHRNTDPLSTYCGIYHAQSSVGRASDRVPVPREFQTLPGEQTWTKEAPQDGYITNCWGGRNSRRKRGSKSSLSTCVWRLENLILCNPYNYLFGWAVNSSKILMRTQRFGAEVHQEAFAFPKCSHARFSNVFEMGSLTWILWSLTRQGNRYSPPLPLSDSALGLEVAFI